jgi:hypothetical protein
MPRELYLGSRRDWIESLKLCADVEFSSSNFSATSPTLTLAEDKSTRAMLLMSDRKNTVEYNEAKRQKKNGDGYSIMWH